MKRKGHCVITQKFVEKTPHLFQTLNFGSICSAHLSGLAS